MAAQSLTARERLELALKTTVGEGEVKYLLALADIYATEEVLDAIGNALRRLISEFDTMRKKGGV